MSRCFPFPPPGYERKLKADEPSLLKKEKHKEKNQKKEKKESKEKREKERTDEKRRDKKDKKEKHRDPDKDQYKGDGLFPDEKRTLGAPDVHLHKFREKSKNRENDGSVTLGEKRAAGPPVFNNGESVSKDNHLASQTKIFKNSPGSGRRNIDEERRVNNQLPNKNVSAERQKGVVKISGTVAGPIIDAKEKTNERPVVEKKDVPGFIGKPKISENALGQNVVGPVRLPGKSPGPLVDGRERKDKHATDGRMGGWAVSGEARSGGSSLPPNFVGTAQNRVGPMVRPVEKKYEQKLEERTKVREVGEFKKGEKRKEEVKEKSIHQDKEKKKEEKVKATSELKKLVQAPGKVDGSENHMLIPSCKNEIKKDLSATQSGGLQSILKPSSQGAETLLGKRKDIALNGIYDEHVTGSNKLAKTTVSTPPLTKNGRSLEPCQNSAAYAARPPMNIKAERTFAPDETQRSPMNIKMDGKERKINDINSEPITQTSQSTSKAERKSKVYAKPPHPDTKYLSQVLTVPKLEEWPEFDDQEWLFSSNNSQTRKSEVETSEVEEEPLVWANTLWLEPADIFALPYVIPH